MKHHYLPGENSHDISPQNIYRSTYDKIIILYLVCDGMEKNM
jgi:hypothetical protein